MSSAFTPLGTPVQDLQNMLRTLTRVHRDIPFLVPDGQFGEKTLEAVLRFQLLAGLPVTGVVDQLTWDSLRDERDRVQHQTAAPRSAFLFPHNQAVLRQGNASPLLYPIQGMFLALADVFAEVEATALSGFLDEATAQNVRWVQEKGRQPVTGDLDRDTWDLLTGLYETFVTRQYQSP